MKKIILLASIVLMCFTSCDKKENKNDELELNSSVTMDETGQNYDVNSTDSTKMSNDSVTNGSANLPNTLKEGEKTVENNPAEGKFPLSETKWLLTELNGKKVTAATKDYFINLDSKSGTFVAFAGCNNLKGSYTMVKAKKLTFSNIISTRMACNNRNVESDFIKVLNKSQNYTVNEDELILLNGQKIIARFGIK